ncbi:hypothetical protein [Mesobacillus zeae]|uniref:hypothetical protein n=1 Tax=Mesobacillus zeae TaxID=1917180 RepID=UPI0015E7DA5A|nr:hypothetical protein [Mesobacillus zeae]
MHEPSIDYDKIYRALLHTRDIAKERGVYGPAFHNLESAEQNLRLALVHGLSVCIRQ